jgi:hypothetical protein
MNTSKTTAAPPHRRWCRTRRCGAFTDAAWDWLKLRRTAERVRRLC